MTEIGLKATHLGTKNSKSMDMEDVNDSTSAVESGSRDMNCNIALTPENEILKVRKYCEENGLPKPNYIEYEVRLPNKDSRNFNSFRCQLVIGEFTAAGAR